ncbi:MAG: acyl carrier protein [Candidatus Buchananbacteria bacterium CG10_big_fil_rev_8_21_14_0_10_42_9]|uniref:Acyl carrier protein n=1 Tax=Candidatus Buchananbacteria bacterium CG10_big_fil_rev_8_21_14_0_10_42_9 TaxID=1974526 RepID=A0A2H0W0P4_9BACT|nr:MAG: acyl carrier protein [Candidatus Buchananbacteria bacterium CG10_big_fil_rev_8_21_14_0_10_42_9]
MNQEIIETIRETLYLTADQINENTLIEEIAKDSMDIVELVAVLGSQYKVAFQPEKMAHIKTVGDVIKYVTENMDTSDSSDPLKSF